MGRPSIWLCLRQAIDLKPIFSYGSFLCPLWFHRSECRQVNCLQNFEYKLTYWVERPGCKPETSKWKNNFHCSCKAYLDRAYCSQEWSKFLKKKENPFFDNLRSVFGLTIGREFNWFLTRLSLKFWLYYQILAILDKLTPGFLQLKPSLEHSRYLAYF